MNLNDTRLKREQKLFCIFILKGINCFYFFSRKFINLRLTLNLVKLDQLHKILQRNDSSVDERRAVDIFYLDFTKAAGTVSSMILINKMLLRG